MRGKINQNQQKKRYAKSLFGASFEAHISRDGGWTDYLISEKIIFSHRVNDYAMNDLPEKLHSHNYYELTFVLAEEGVEYIADGQSLFLSRGMAILTKPMQFHMFRLTKPMRYDRYVLYFKDPEEIFPQSAIMDFAKRGGSSCAVFALSENLLLAHLKESEKVLSQVDSPYASSKALLNFYQLFLLLSENGGAFDEKKSNFPPHFIHEIKEYIDENFLDIQSVQALAKEFFYSREYVSRIFRQYYNTPIYEYILGRKLQHSSQLLKKGESVEFSARASGFGNLSGFVKLFRKFYGCAPSEYKTRHRL